MLLRIIDQGNDEINIEFQSTSLHKSFPIEFYDSPVYSSYQQDLAWYFAEYPLSLIKDQQTDRTQKIIQRLIAFGQSMGEKLKGEDFELVGITEQIEKQGYPELQVRLEAQQPEFFAEIWEAMVLPEAKYMLSCVSQGFTRTYVDQLLPDLIYDLQVTSAMDQQVAAMMQTPQAEPITKPLKVTKWLSRGVQDADVVSDSFNVSLDAYTSGGTVQFNLINPLDVDELFEALACHVLHYDGAIIIEGQQVFFQLSDGTRLAVVELAKHLVSKSIPCLFVQPSQILCLDGTDVNAQQALARLAKMAQQQGLGNIVGASQLSPCWIADLCFKQLYTSIGMGFELGQAVVETRKTLQANVTLDLVDLQPQSFHPWSLLQHYSHQRLQYFVTGHQLSDPNMSGQQGFYQCLFGFKTVMLPPLLQQTSDGQVAEIYHKMRRHGGVNVLGERGSGKTQAAHLVALYVAQQPAGATADSIDFCFYFDFASDSYQIEHLQQMIAPVLGLDVNELMAVDDSLSQKSCLFVFDHCQSMPVAIVDHIQQKWGNRHYYLYIGNNQSLMSQVNLTAQVTMQPLTLDEQHILIIKRLRQLGIKQAPDAQSYQILAELDGRPWVLEQLAPLLVEDQDKPDEDLSALIGELAQTTDPVSCFYLNRWNRLSVTSQRLLSLTANIHGLLLEMLMIAFDQKQSNPVKTQLLTDLQTDDLEFSALITSWQQAGFVRQYPHGRMIEQRSLPFIHAQWTACFADISTQQEQIDLGISQLLCQGISMLVRHVLNQPDQNISNNLLMNRREWVKHFERLWFNQDHQLFMMVKQSFEQLMMQAKLVDEFNQWLFDLLKRSEPIELSSDGDLPAQLSWLSLAINGLAAKPETPDEAGVEHTKFIQVADNAQTWLDQQPEAIAASDLPMMQQVVGYLEVFYQQKQDWQACLKVCQLALHNYQRHEAWQRVIAISRSMALAYDQLGQTDKALACEQVIIAEVPYDGAPDGFKHQQYMDILFARLQRKDTKNAQILLDNLQEQKDIGPIKPMLEGVQCDIHYQNGDYVQAVPYFCKTWQQTQGDQQRLMQLHPRLRELEEKIGTKQFDQLFSQHAGDDCLHPRDFVIE